MNSCTVDIQFASARAARRFYHGAPGAQLLSGNRVFHCVEGDESLANELERIARKQQFTREVRVHRYAVEEA